MPFSSRSKVLKNPRGCPELTVAPRRGREAEVSSPPVGAAIRLDRVLKNSLGPHAPRSGWAALALLGLVACGGPSANTDPLATIAELVAEEDRSPPPLMGVWSRTSESPLTLRPAVGERHVYLAFGNVLEAWRVEDGAFVWRHELDSNIAAPPAAIGQQVVVATVGTDAFPPRIVWVSNEGNIVALRDVEEAVRQIEAAPGIVVIADSGSVSRVASAGWRVELAQIRHIALSVDHSLVYVTLEGRGIVALDLRDGSRRWQYETPGVRLTKPIVNGDFVYVAGTSGYIAALQATTGKKRWTRSLGSIDILGAPAIAGNILWVAGLDAHLFGLKPSNGTVLFVPLELPSRNYLDMATFGIWTVLGPQYGPWMAVRGPTDSEGSRPPTRISTTPPPTGIDLELPPASGAAGVAVINGTDTVVFLRPQRPRIP